MTPKQCSQLLRYARKTIRFFGYRTTSIIQVDLMNYFNKKMLSRPDALGLHHPNDDINNIIERIPDDNRFFVIEYARQKDENKKQNLYYYNPFFKESDLVNDY